jgi:hypothetical protein
MRVMIARGKPVLYGMAQKTHPCLLGITSRHLANLLAPVGISTVPELAVPT